MWFTTSFSKMVSPRHLVVYDHVSISLLPTKFALSSYSKPSFLTKITNDDFCFELLSHKKFAFFCALKVLFFFSFFTLLHKCIDVIEVEEKLLLTGKLFSSKSNINKNNTRSPANTFALQSHIENTNSSWFQI